MKLLRYGPAGQERPGLLDGEGLIRDLSSVVPDISGKTLSRAGIEALRRLDTAALPLVADPVRIGPCVAGVGNFIAVGLNYADHARESGLPIPAEPVLFNKAPSSISGPNDPIVVPPGSSKLDWEVEIAMVIGEAAYDLPEADAPDVIAGYCVCHDVSERAFQNERGGQWTKGKSSPGFGPLGPYLVTADAIAEPQDLTLWLDVNGVRMQSGSTATMIFGLHFLVSYISRFMRLEPGDVITTGTPPGVGMGRHPPRYLKAGDRVELGITGLGTQRQQVLAHG
ncbi:2-keto-4-pentenoate hydratase/2-oxohepta-3-ene-1,7-dioic acid hydratase (catechol pathway) [Pseudoxanthobacter soli DSM 19599]|uniref:2-keto-4-pentenoate hydratase/2-oxohepta-3-ene-1,7-dioic acid hydratase (Catechol pathway) n=1 Tax=Pseudoxanthobacter soli DSM 19599 TaxID=1123029 RepID=A0A1M7ZM63_9HYPH|nr:fumarylacetoacetate hydrolase family protein [Pseudoxanthobacter soli]SHO66004.1 2-keto-4-pentenoate hydratase/2-oxohepta-3-ene-1,7-dioic acid hydratase (catechol pathway) [Pseudoxanthobacter soli DSM 19599]